MQDVLTEREAQTSELENFQHFTNFVESNFQGLNTSLYKLPSQPTWSQK